MANSNHKRIDLPESSPDDMPDTKLATTHQQPHHDKEITYPSGPSLAAIFIGLFLTVLCTGLDRSIVSTAVPKITAEFNSLNDIAWYPSAYLIATSCFQLLFGKLYAEFDVKWVFLSSLLLFEVGSVVCATAPSSLALILGRAISGTGVAGIVSGALIIVARSVPVHNRPKFTGAMGGATGIATVVAPTLGGLFTDKLTWRWCFWINLPFGGVTFLVVLLLVRIPGDSGTVNTTHGITEFLKKIDLLGTLLLIPWVICLLLALQWGGSTHAWDSWRIILLLTFFAILFSCWITIQVMQGTNSTIPIRLMKQRSLVAATLYTLCTYGTFFIVIYYVSIWFQAVRGVSAYHSGINFLTASVAMALTVIVSGFVTTRVGYYVPNMVASTVITSVAAGLIYTFNRNTSTAFWMGALIIFGIGIGLGLQQPFIAAQTLFTGPDLALSTSVIIFVQTLAGAIILSVAANILQNEIVVQLRHLVPAVNPQDVLKVGASGLKEAMRDRYPQYLDGILTAYNHALQRVFLISIITACMGVFGVVGMEWISVNKDKKRVTEGADDKPAASASSV